MRDAFLGAEQPKQGMDGFSGKLEREFNLLCLPHYYDDDVSDITSDFSLVHVYDITHDYPELLA